MAKGGGKILFGLLLTILLAGGLAGGGAWYWIEQRPATYRATALLSVDPDATDVSIGDLATLFQSDAIAKELLEKSMPLFQEKSPGSAPGSFEAVRAAMNVETRVALQTQSQIVHDRVLRLHYTAENPEVAAEVAKTWAALCAQWAGIRATTRRAEKTEPLTKALEAAETALNLARIKQSELTANGSLETLEAAALEGAKALQALRETVRTLEAAAARDEAALQALKTYLANAPVAVALELAVKEADAVSDLAGAKAESAYALAKLPEVEAAQAEAQTRLAQARREHEAVEAEIARLELDVRELESALRAAGPAEVAGIQLESQVVTPSRPLGPDRYTVAGAAAAFGALAGLIAYFGLVALRVYARELERA